MQQDKQAQQQQRSDASTQALCTNSNRNTVLPTHTTNTATVTTVDQNPYAYGGGLYVAETTLTSITDSDFLHNEVEGSVSEITSKPKGTIFVSAPLGIGKKVIAPIIPDFQEIYPDIEGTDPNIRANREKMQSTEIGEQTRLPRPSPVSNKRRLP